MSEFKSWRSYWDFEASVRRKLRYVRTPEIESFLDCVLKSSEDRKITLNKGNVYWRAQLGHDWREEQDGDERYKVHCPHPHERMLPLRDRALEGRANPKGIPCLYLATSKEAAMSEVRPWIGSYISVGQFKLLRTLKIVNCSRNHIGTPLPLYLEEPSPEEREEAVWAYIDKAFAEPMTRSDDTADYAATQILAELFKRAGFDGVGYKSNFGKYCSNIALFDIDAAELLNCGLFRADKINMKFSMQDNPYFLKSRKKHD